MLVMPDWARLVVQTVLAKFASMSYGFWEFSIRIMIHYCLLMRTILIYNFSFCWEFDDICFKV